MNINDIRINPNNPRFIKDDRYQKLKNSIKDFPKMMKLRPIIIDNNNIIIGGNMRYLVMKDMGYTEIPEGWVVKGEDLTEEERRKFIVIDNIPYGDWNYDILANEYEIVELQEWGVNLDELEGAIETKEDDFDVDKAVEAVKEPICKGGDIWQLGEHRLMCGDSTVKEGVEKLMDGKKAIACVTDPPYSVDYQNLKRTKNSKTEKEQGQSYKDPKAEDLLKFIEIIPSDILVMTYLFNKHFHELSNASMNWEMLYECVWVKNAFTFIMGRNYQPQHEPILIMRRKKAKNFIFNVPNNKSTVFNYNRPLDNKEHPTMKPIGLYIELVKYHSNENDLIYEPFGGSGTTLIACEQTNRICYGMEIDPIYCDVIIKRWEEYSGKKAVKIND